MVNLTSTPKKIMQKMLTEIAVNILKIVDLYKINSLWKVNLIRVGGGGVLFKMQKFWREGTQ